jgi:hypothetical protein
MLEYSNAQPWASGARCPQLRLVLAVEPVYPNQAMALPSDATGDSSARGLGKQSSATAAAPSRKRGRPKGSSQEVQAQPELLCTQGSRRSNLRVRDTAGVAASTTPFSFEEQEKFYRNIGWGSRDKLAAEKNPHRVREEESSQDNETTRAKGGEESSVRQA